MPPLKECLGRWNDHFTSAAIAFLEGKALPPFSPLENGLIDLRGLVISKVLRNVKINGADLSGARFEGFGQFGMCSFENSKFCFATLQTNLGNSFKACDFSSSKLTGAVLRGNFERCNFSKANMSSVRAREVKFIDCQFEKTNLRNAHLLYSHFEMSQLLGCSFGGGSLSFSTFVNSQIPVDDLQGTLIEKIKIIQNQ
jgi:uncharacterized protein YjbI with pentapeptide repeats